MYGAGPEWNPVEIPHVVFEYKVPELIINLMEDAQPNLPWAETHFMERVGGKPLNPPPSHEFWPYAQGGNEEHMKDGKFSHTYPERFWPVAAGIENKTYFMGLRFRYGDYEDLCKLLCEHPDTRQAYLPIWFPEDLTAARQGERVPCTLGYHFIVRQDRLNLFYPMRSCDIVRYFKDDAYMAARLVQWTLSVLKDLCTDEADYEFWDGVKPGILTMHIVSAHCFVGDLENIRRGLYRAAA